MLLYGSTLFLSAFLLFWIQPLLGKRLLPWFGGSPAVWTTCILFFQVLLLGGYCYAHLLSRWRSSGRQATCHALLLTASLLALPALYPAAGKPGAGSWPIARILGLLTVSTGFPYFMLASTSPLLQSWFGRGRPGLSPYRLYSLSNAGSLLALLGFPFLIEPAFPLRSQAGIWTLGYVVFAAFCGVCALRFGRFREGVAGSPLPEVFGPGMKPGTAQRVLWLLLPACSSLMLLATTNQLCLDVAAVPLLWVLPLGLYLVSFILCFHHPRWYSRLFFGILLAAAVAWSCDVLTEGVFAGLGVQIASCSLTLFAACMVCHGELARIKPDPRYLTGYYGMIAAGGALGGMLVTLAAPVLCKGYWEYHVALFAAGLVFVAVLYVDRTKFLYRGRRVWAWMLLCAPLALLAVVLGAHLRLAMTGNLEMVRNFYGVLRVYEADQGDPRLHRVTLMHGRVQHGFQYQAPFRRNWPTSYYGPASGIGLALRYHPRRIGNPVDPGSFRIGVVGLGAGTLASYGQAGDYIRFYEINPDVVRLCRRYFSYVKDTRAQVDIVAGDARISMQREQGSGADGRFDVLAVDAFSGDAIPVHLLTRECAEVYRSHLKPDGILALHVSSRYFDLAPVARGFAQLGWGEGTEAVLVPGARRQGEGVEASEWVLVTSNAEFLSADAVRRAVRPWTEDDPPARLWTDNDSNLFQLMRRPR